MYLLAVAVILSPFVAAFYAYVGYPLLLIVAAKLRGRPAAPRAGVEWPSVTITVPVHNVATSVRTTLEHLLAVDYPRDRLQLLVISDASSDGTDAIVTEFASRGIELLRLGRRQGKTAAENAALAASRGDIIVNVDATVLIPPASLKRLVRVFDDPTIGVASGRDVSVGAGEREATTAESGYVGYEMWVRDLETRVGSIVGASGCFYAIRRFIHDTHLPEHLSWDFASALVARERGFRSVSVGDAVCIVPRTAEIRTELRRKVRTMARGLSTLMYKRALMNPIRYGSFAFMLISHKLLRWLPYLLAPVALIALGVLALASDVARGALVAALAGLAVGVFGMRRNAWGVARRPVALVGFAVAAFTAGFMAWIEALRQRKLATWDPTPRPEVRLT
jgi:cellulose synthase/poly-beta-1,6-N-acetylglucosamine synthase-like glycosyltransferase